MFEFELATELVECALKIKKSGVACGQCDVLSAVEVSVFFILSNEDPSDSEHTATIKLNKRTDVNRTLWTLTGSSL